MYILRWLQYREFQGKSKEENESFRTISGGLTIVLISDKLSSYPGQGRAAVSLAGSYPEGRWFKSIPCPI
jgi:hypothetical protein